jgi:hypothetical protein
VARACCEAVKTKMGAASATVSGSRTDVRRNFDKNETISKESIHSAASGATGGSFRFERRSAAKCASDDNIA